MSANSATPKHSGQPSSPQAKQSQITRRAVLQAAAWSVPAVSLAVAAPALAASADGIPPGSTVTVGLTRAVGTTVARCSTLSDITMELRVDGQAVAGNQTVEVSIPDGFSFSSTALQQTVSGMTNNGLFNVPPIYVEPSVAGTFPITATWAFTYSDGVPGTATATLPMRVTVPLVPATLLTRTTTAENSGMTTTQLTFSNPQGGAAAERLYYVVNNGNLRYWGALVGITNHTGAGTASVSNNAIANVHSSLHGIWSARDNDVTLTNANVGGGLFVTRSGGTDAVYLWRATGNAPTVRLITPPTGGWGTIRQVQTRWRSNYVLTTAGLYYISPITSATGGGAVTQLNIDPATIRAISAYGNFSDHAGVIVVTTTGGVLRANRGVSTMTTLNFATGEVARVAERHGPYTFILTESGKVIWRYLESGTWQTGFSTFGTGAAGTSPVLSMSTWRKSDYAGGTLLHADGSVTVFIRLAGATIANGTAYNYSPAKFGNSPVVNTFASDGGFLALTQDGTLWGWGGNPDRATKGEPAIEATNVSHAMIWGWHRGNGEYLGGGFASTTLGTCSF